MTKNQAKRLHDKLWDICILCEAIAYHDLKDEVIDEYDLKIIDGFLNSYNYLKKVFKHENKG